MRLSAAFVVTVSTSLGACRDRATPEARSNPTVETADPPEVKTATRKRKRTAEASERKFATGNTPWAAMTALNPKGADGKAIYLASDDSCFVEVPRKDPAKVLVPGERPLDQKVVDCPEALDDAAWDNCSWGTLHAVKGEPDCLCVSLGGNPPPPPWHVACPTTK